MSNVKVVSLLNPGGVTIYSGVLGLSAGTTQAVSGTVVFSNSNGVSFGMNAGTVTATVKTDYLTTAMASNRASDFVQANAGFAGTSASGTIASNGISISIGPYITTAMQSNAATISNIRVSAGTTSNLLSALTFSNANGMSFGLDAGTVTGSYTVPTVPAQLSAGLSNVGNTAGDTGVITGRVVFVGTNNITLSGSTNGGSMTISISGGAGNTGSISAGTTRGTLGEVVFADSNGVSFGMNGQTFTATVKTDYLTTAMQSNAATLSNLRLSAGTTSNLLSAVTFANSNGVSFGLDAGTVTGSVAAAVAQTNQAMGLYGSSNTQLTSSGTVDARSFTIRAMGSLTVAVSASEFVLSAPNAITTAMLSNAVTLSNIRVSGGTTSGLLSAITFADSNGVSFGLNAGTMTATVKTDYLTTAMQSNAATISNIRVSAGTTSNLLSAVTFGDGNGISFGLNASTVTASHNALTSQSNQNVTAGNGGFAFQTLSFSNVNGVSFGTSAGSAITASVAAQTNQTLGLYGSSNTQLTSSGTVDARSLTIRAMGSLTIAVSASEWVLSAPNAITTAMLSNAVTLSNIRVSGGTTSNLLSALTFGDANGISFGLNASTMTASHNGLTSQSNQAFSADAMSNFQTLVFQDSNGVSFSNNAGSLRVTHGLQFTSATSAITSNAMHSSQSRMTLYAVSNTTQSTSGTIPFSALSFAGAGIASVGVSNGSVIVSVPPGAPSPVNFSAGTTSSDLGSVVFSNGNGVSFGLNGATITASVNGAGGGIGAGVSTGGNTLGSTGTVTTGDVVFVGSNNITLSQSTGAAGSAATITISGPSLMSAGMSNLGLTFGTSGVVATQIVFVGTRGLRLSQSVNGQSATISFDDDQRTISSFQNMPVNIGSSVLTFGMTSLSQAAAFLMPQFGSFSYLRLLLTMQTNSTTIATLASATASAQGALHHTFNAVVYSMGVNASSLSLQSVASGSVGMTFSQKISITNSTQGSYSLGITANANGGAGNTSQSTQYSISGTNYSFTTNSIATQWNAGRFLDIPFETSLAAGNYWLVIGGSSSTSSAGAAGLAAITNCNVRYSGHYGASQQNVGFGVMGSLNMTSGGQLGAGFFSTAGGGTTNSIPISAISSTASNPVPFFMFGRTA